MSAARDADPFEIATESVVLRGEQAGEGPLVVLAHGLTATRRYVLHGSRALERAGYSVASYDARGHGSSGRPADGVYTYAALASDLGAVVEHLAPDGEPVFLAGHSMGAHTIAAYALARPQRVRAACFVGPAYPGHPAPADELEGWDELADGVESGGVEGFIEVYSRREWPSDWRETVMRITRERLALHESRAGFGEALRYVPRSTPFGGLEDLEGVRCPVLVVGSHDEADPGHPYEIAKAWAAHLPDARLVSEEPGDSPLAWQGGRLAREIAAFFDDVRA